MWIALTAVLLVVGACVLWGRRRLLVVRVMGQSMLPALHDGQKLLAHRTSRVPSTGTIVVVDPFENERLVVKRVAAVAGEPVPPEVMEAAGTLPGGTVPQGSLVLLGDNADASIDSRTWGLMPVSSVVAVVVRKMHGNARPESEWLLMDEPVPVAELDESVQYGAFSFRFRANDEPH